MPRWTLSTNPALCRCTSAQPTRFANFVTLPLVSNSCNASGVSPAAAATRWRTSATDVSTPPDSAVRVGEHERLKVRDGQ